MLEQDVVVRNRDRCSNSYKCLHHKDASAMSAEGSQSQEVRRKKRGTELRTRTIRLERFNKNKPEKDLKVEKGSISHIFLCQFYTLVKKHSLS